jgi:hypothetical protein
MADHTEDSEIQIKVYSMTAVTFTGRSYFYYIRTDEFTEFFSMSYEYG